MEAARSRRVAVSHRFQEDYAKSHPPRVVQSGQKWTSVDTDGSPRSSAGWRGRVGSSSPIQREG